MVAVEIDAGGRVQARFAAALFAAGGVCAGHSVHVGGWGADVGNVAVEFWHGGESADFFEYAFFAAALDEFALVCCDRAEVAASEAAPVGYDAVFDHIVCGDAFAFVATCYGVELATLYIALNTVSIKKGGNEANAPRIAYQNNFVGKKFRLQMKVESTAVSVDNQLTGWKYTF